MREIPQKTVAKVLWDAGFRSPGSMMRRGKIPQRSAERYIKSFKEGGDHQRKKYSPRKSVKQSSVLIRKAIKKAKDRDRIRTSREIGNEMGVSHSHVQRMLKKSGFKYAGYKKKVVINEDTRIKRLNMAHTMKQRESDWGFTVFTDECSFWLTKSKPNKVWSDNHIQEEGGGTHGYKVHVWGGITARGALKLEMFEEDLNSPNYLKIMIKKRAELNKLYPEGYIWQQDGSPIHRAEICTDYISKAMPQSLIRPEWPSYSPDLSPIENIWGWLKNKVSKDMPKTSEVLKNSIERHWDSINIEFLEPYFNSMPTRMDMLIENDGLKIKY